MCLELQKQRVAKVKEGLTEAKKRAHSRSQSSEPTVSKNRKGKTKKSHTQDVACAHRTSGEEVPREIYVPQPLSHDTLSDDDQSVSYIQDKPDICKTIIYDEDTIQSTDSTNSNSLDLSSYDDATHAHNDIDIEIDIAQKM